MPSSLDDNHGFEGLLIDDLEQDELRRAGRMGFRRVVGSKGLDRSRLQCTDSYDTATHNDNHDAAADHGDDTATYHGDDTAAHHGDDTAADDNDHSAAKGAPRTLGHVEWSGTRSAELLGNWRWRPR